MSAPAYRMISTAAPSGRYGLDAYGTSPYGGSAPRAYRIPPLRNESDIPEHDLLRIASDVVIERDGIPLSVSVWGEARVLLHQFRALTMDQVLQLRTFWRARVFDFLPDGPEGGTSWRVCWRGDFERASVKRRRDGLYNVDVNLVEVWQ